MVRLLLRVTAESFLAGSDLKNKMIMKKIGDLKRHESGDLRHESGDLNTSHLKSRQFSVQIIKCTEGWQRSLAKIPD